VTNYQRVLHGRCERLSTVKRSEGRWVGRLTDGCLATVWCLSGLFSPAAAPTPRPAVAETRSDGEATVQVDGPVDNIADRQTSRRTSWLRRPPLRTVIIRAIGCIREWKILSNLLRASRQYVMCSFKLVVYTMYKLYHVYWQAQVSYTISHSDTRLRPAKRLNGSRSCLGWRLSGPVNIVLDASYGPLRRG